MFQKYEHICEKHSIPVPSQNEIQALDNEDIDESTTDVLSEDDGTSSDEDTEYSFDSHGMEDNEFPMDQLLMILLKHFYRGGIFIVWKDLVNNASS